MKYITFAVPSYNSQDYLSRCVESLLAGGEDVEIILVNDGSSDGTKELIDEYVEKYPSIIRGIHKKNGGHGSGVNVGLENATGIYYKVVDSDDWLDEEAYATFLAKIKEHVDAHIASQETMPDLYICNYTYNHLDEGKAKTMSFRNVFREHELITWDDMKSFRPSQYLIMHSLTFRTKLLKASNVKLPEHCFYVDNIFAYVPLPYVRTIYYMDIPLYQYYLGRDDQSVNEEVMKSRIDQQIKVTKIIIDAYDIDKIKKRSKKLASYMYRNVSIMLVVSDIHLLLIGDKEAIEKKKDLWKHIKAKDRSMYRRLMYRNLSGLTNMPRALNRFTVGCYRIAKKVYKFQ